MQVPPHPGSSVLLPPSANAAILTSTIVAALYFGSSVFVPLALAVLLSFVLNPLVVLLRKVHLPRGAAVGVVVALFVATVTLLGMAMARQVTELANDLPRYDRGQLMSDVHVTRAARSGSTPTSVTDSCCSCIDRKTQSGRHCCRSLWERSH